MELVQRISIVKFSALLSWDHKNILIWLCKKDVLRFKYFCQWASEILHLWLLDPWALLGEYIWRAVTISLDMSACFSTGRRMFINTKSLKNTYLMEEKYLLSWSQVFQAYHYNHWFVDSEKGLTILWGQKTI